MIEIGQNLKDLIDGILAVVGILAGFWLVMWMLSR
jgi:hypothetical protein